MSTYLSLTPELLETEHICCAIADKICTQGYQAKKTWLTQRMAEGYTFRRLDERGKVFIEYAPIEAAWNPIDAPGAMVINCFWVSGRFKGHGHARDLLQACEQDARAQGKTGLVALTSVKKKPFLADKAFFLSQGFQVVDSAPPYFELVYKSLVAEGSDEGAVRGSVESTARAVRNHTRDSRAGTEASSHGSQDNATGLPKFLPSCKTGTCPDAQGLAIYYSQRCPFNDHYTGVLADYFTAQGVPVSLHLIEDRQTAMANPSPDTILSIYFNGKFVTHELIPPSKVEKFFQQVVG